MEPAMDQGTEVTIETIRWEGEDLDEKRAREVLAYNTQVGYQWMNQVSGAEKMVDALVEQAGSLWLKGQEDKAKFLRDTVPEIAADCLAKLNHDYRDWFDKHVKPLGMAMNEQGWQCDW